MNEEKQAELLPCPFCGGEAEINILLGNYCVTCSKCSGSIFPHSGMTKAEAIAAWNTRKPVDRILKRLEERKGGYVERYAKTFEPTSRAAYESYDEAIDIVKEELGIVYDKDWE